MLKNLLSHVGKYKKSAFLGMFMVVAEALLEVLIPFLMADFIDKGIENGNMPYALKLGLFLLLCAIVSLACGMIGAQASTRSAVGFATNIRRSLFNKVQTFSFESIDKFSTSSIITRITTDVNNVMNAFVMCVRIGCRAPCMMIFSVIFAFKASSRLAWMYIAAIPVLALILYLIVCKAHPIFERVFHLYDKLNLVVQENLNGIRVVKSFVREEYEVEKFNNVSDDIFRNFVKAERLAAFNGPSMQFVVYVCLLLASWFGAKFIVAGTMTTGQLTSIIAYATMILSSLMMLSMIFITVTIASTSGHRIVEVLNEESTLTSPENGVTEVKNGDISFENVNFSYSGRSDNLCLKNINLTIKSGQTVGIIGGTGSSKSTLISMIPRLYDPNEGMVTVGGINVKDYDLTALRDAVSVVLQKNELFTGTIADNLRWGNNDATDEEIRHACRLAKADEFIEKFPNSYETRIERGGANVSGGQKQRLCIARALLKHPKILILDDSTSAVDTATDAAIRKGFREFIPETTKIIIAQRIASVQDADMIIVMDNGRILNTGTHDELMETSDIYREVYTSQQKGGK